MKTQKRTYNTLLLRYNKYRNKLFRLHTLGKNEHRQGVLKKHIERLFIKLRSLQLSISKRTILAASFAAAMSLSTVETSAQIEFHSFNPNPYSLTDIGSLSDPEFTDLDGDGDFDIMAGNQIGEFQYFENIGTNSVPEYGPVQVNPFSLTGVSSSSSNSFTDLDNDGDLDILAGNFNGDLIYFENTGTVNAPLFSAAQTNPFSLTAVSIKAKPDFVDLDGDGDSDLMVGDWNGDLTYFENTGTVSTPSFGVAQVNPFLLNNVSGGFQNPDFVDLDNDGDKDMMCGRTNGTFFFYLNLGTVNAPSFSLQPTNPFNLIGMSDSYSSPALADLDNDGDFDLISGNAVGEFHYMKNIGTNVSPSFSDLQTNQFSLTTVGAYTSPNFGDLDGDGDLDMIAGENSGNFHYFENIGTNLSPDYATVQIDPFSLTDVGFASAPVFVDLDGDGDLDLMSGNTSGDFIYFENVGSSSTPNFATAQTNPYLLAGISGNNTPRFVDLDGDGDFDLLASEVNGSFNYFENIGTSSSPSFGTVQNNPFSLASVIYRSSPAFADLDNDGDFDLLSGDYYANLKYYENIGTASSPDFGTAQLNPFNLVGYSNNYNSAPTFADLDADGDMDLMVGYSSPGKFKYFENISACSMNTGVSQTSITLTADQNNANYQWVDCDNGNAQINGATNQSFTPTVNGNYACEIDLTNCSDITTCTAITSVGIGESLNREIEVYPNPATSQVTINIDDPIKEVKIFNVTGELVKTVMTNTFSIESLANGVYMINVKTENGIMRSRFTKE